MVSKVNAWIMAVVLLVGMLAGCNSQVQEQDALEFNYPAIRKARAKLREGDKQSALDLLNRAIDEKPKLAQPHLEIAQLYDDYDHNYVRAIYHYERYLELRPQTEKKEMIEGFIRKAKIDFAASMAEQVPGMDKKMQALQAENDQLKQDLRQVRENLARRIAAPASPAKPSGEARVPPRAAVPITPLGRVSGRSSEPALTVDGAPIGESATAEPATAEPASAGLIKTTASAVKPEPASGAAGTRYRVQRGDTLSIVAARVYHNPRKWKLIYDANQNTLGGSQKLKTGQMLIIPK